MSATKVLPHAAMRRLIEASRPKRREPTWLGSGVGLLGLGVGLGLGSGLGLGVRVRVGGPARAYRRARRGASPVEAARTVGEGGEGGPG